MSEAEGYYLKSLDLRQKILPEDHPDILASKHNLGELYMAIGDKEKGSQYLLEVMETIKRQDEQETAPK